jgi:c-di-GMP-binding flagellar brake protein YcgR
MGISVMTQKKTLNYSEIKSLFLEAQQQKPPIIGSLVVDGKWQIIELEMHGFSGDYINFSTQEPCQKIKRDHPIGVCIHLGYFKYLFGSTVQATELQGSSWCILLNRPDSVERIERRVYHRQAVPVNSTVKVAFWHRGYLDDSENEPTETYWQGTLLNLSAGGARFEIEIEHKEHFRTGQLLGIQFTPMSYQKPLLLETHVKYTEEQSDNRHFRIGVEFLGLEASPEGRQLLDRILEVIGQYAAMNNQKQVCSNG